MVVHLDCRVDIQRPVAGQDAVYGAATPAWALVATVWAEVQDVLPSRSEAVKQGLVQGRRQARVRIRYRADVDASMRIVLGARVMQIVGGPSEIGRKEYLEMLVEEFTTRGGS